MTQGPDPNRNFDTDRDLTGAEQARGGGIGSPRRTRLGLSSWFIVGVVVILAAALIFAML